MTTANRKKIAKVELESVLKLDNAVIKYAAKATLEDGEKVELFRFYANEAYFTNDYFTGKTVEEARAEFESQEFKMTM